MHWKRTIWVAVLMFALAPAAKATPLPPGGSVVPSAQTLASLGTLVTSVNVPFTGVNALSQTLFSGTLVNSVYSNANGLAFTYQLTSNPTSLDAISRLSTTDFTTFTTDVGYVSPGVIPTRSDRDSGSLVGFDLFGGPGGGIFPGQSSATLVIQTNALNFARTGSTNLINGAVTSVLSFRPVAAVPEPATLVLAGVGLPLASLLGYARRRRSQPA